MFQQFCQHAYHANIYVCVRALALSQFSYIIKCWAESYRLAAEKNVLLVLMEQSSVDLVQWNKAPSTWHVLPFIEHSVRDNI